jgi:DNA-binding NarL/FixJ family response regulator
MAICVDNHTVSPTVLIVDDHATFRKTARALLEADGYEVIGEAPDGHAGIEAIRQLRPDVVLLDVRLPDADGFDMAALMTRNGHCPAIIVTSSSDDPLYPGRAAGCGAHGFLAKHDVCGAALDRLLADDS